jgi:hypothetical protein
MTVSEMDAGESPLIARLRASSAALQDLEQAVKSGDLDPRVLNEFRNAMDHIRNTAQAVQEWFAAQERRGDPYAVLPALAAQRVHRATQLAKDLTLDLQNVEVGVDTPGLGELHEAVDGLNRHLGVLFRRKA